MVTQPVVSTSLRSLLASIFDKTGTVVAEDSILCRNPEKAASVLINTPDREIAETLFLTVFLEGKTLRRRSKACRHYDGQNEPTKKGRCFH